MNKSGCLICGKKLIYKDCNELLTCYICGSSFEANVMCENKHYVCDSCHSDLANNLIEKHCAETPVKNPIEIALELLKLPAIHMHGPEHHYLVPAVLLTAYYNMINESDNIKEKLVIAKSRAKVVLGGVCGTHGVCGAAVGTGAFISVMTGATPLSVREWSLANEVTAKTLFEVAKNGGPRCCKRNTFIALEIATEFLKEKFNIKFENPVFSCEYSHLNKQCKGKSCKYSKQQGK